jgi:aubergine
LASEEIAGIRRGLKGGQAVVGAGAKHASDVPLSYIVAQKRIATKFMTRNVPGHPDGKFGAPPGTLVEGVQGLKYETFYIQGRAPPFSTPKPVRFIVVEQDKQLDQTNMPQLTWAMSHDYPNWPGPIKVPSVCMHAHKLAELGGITIDCGASINHKALLNTMHFL